MSASFSSFSSEFVASSPLSLSSFHQSGMEPPMPSRSSLNVSSLFQGAPRGSPRRRGQYYFDDGNVIFLVEDTFYNVHRYFFQRDSSSFASIFSLGLKDDEPLPLTGITVGEMDLFLSILYPADFGQYAATTVEDWTSILGLASKWTFESIKALAIKQLDPIASPIDKIVLGRKHDITEWLPEAYSAICGRKEPLTLEEGMRLGMKDVIKIAAARQGENNSDFTATEQLSKIFDFPDVVVNPSLYIDASSQTEDGVGVGKFGTMPETQHQGMSSDGGGQWHRQLYKVEDVACGIAVCATCGLARVCDVWPFCGQFEHGGTCTCATGGKYFDGKNDRSEGNPHLDDDLCSCILCRRVTAVD